jgi:hypothetical protein
MGYLPCFLHAHQEDAIVFGGKPFGSSAQLPLALILSPSSLHRWIPDHCGQYNMYMHPYKCLVVGAVGENPVAPAQPPVWCEDDPSKCAKGAKQMVFFNQLDGNNVFVEGNQADGLPKSPGYNHKMGFKDGACSNKVKLLYRWLSVLTVTGAQNDIFLDRPAARPQSRQGILPVPRRGFTRPLMLKKRHRRL